MTKSIEEIRAEFVARLAAKGIKDPATIHQELVAAGLLPEYVEVVKGDMHSSIRREHLQMWEKNGWRLHDPKT